MERIAILDHIEHRLYVEDVTDEMLAKYNGEEEKYIEDNYDLEEYSWEYIVDAQYISAENDPDPVEIRFEEIG